jgi:hypothetical protein
MGWVDVFDSGIGLRKLFPTGEIKNNALGLRRE